MTWLSISPLLQNSREHIEKLTFVRMFLSFCID